RDSDHARFRAGTTCSIGHIARYSGLSLPPVDRKSPPPLAGRVVGEEGKVCTPGRLAACLRACTRRTSFGSQGIRRLPSGGLRSRSAQRSLVEVIAHGCPSRSPSHRAVAPRSRGANAVRRIRRWSPPHSEWTRKAARSFPRRCTFQPSAAVFTSRREAC